MVEALIRDGYLQVKIPADYLKRAFEYGLTTNNTGKVTDEQEMLHHFARAIEDDEDGSYFGRFIDLVCNDAISDGEHFIEPNKED